MVEGSHWPIIKTLWLIKTWHFNFLRLCELDMELNMNFSHFHKLHHHQKNPFDGNVAYPIWPMEKFARLSNVRHWFPRSQKLFNWILSEQKRLKRFEKFEHQQPVWLTWKKIKNNQSKRAERESLLETNRIIRPAFRFY